ncbi:MAG: AlpA family phage regulatory protein, partial [Herminiimonas sp.]|nr:AlpA family phage regulatory protein [Herminiimonas sp.]
MLTQNIIRLPQVKLRTGLSRSTIYLLLISSPTSILRCPHAREGGGFLPATPLFRCMPSAGSCCWQPDSAAHFT